MSFYSETFVRRTRHKRVCQWCCQDILAGMPSIRASGTYEGDFFSTRFHPECAAASERWYTTNQCWGDPYPDDTMNRGGIAARGEPETSGWVGHIPLSRWYGTALEWLHYERDRQRQQGVQTGQEFVLRIKLDAEDDELIPTQPFERPCHTSNQNSPGRPYPPAFTTP